MNVAILGASHKTDRYSYKAIKLLEEKGHSPFAVHPKIKEIDGMPVYESLQAIAEKIHTITVYLSAANSERISESILASHPRRVIFNPGAENPALAARLEAQGVEVVEGCTLVMLKTKQF
jgi:hypothetical protein